MSGLRVAWLSGGVSSAIATYLARPDWAVYIDVANQHPDTLRFVMDCRDVLDCPITILRDQRYAGSVDNVILDKGFVNSPYGAPCTLELKKRVRQGFERALLEQGNDEMSYIFGYDAGETSRAERIGRNLACGCEFPLIEKGMSKQDCHGYLSDVLGIPRPEMYDLGYSNNNCIGCVKGGKGYWNKIRRDFPEVFQRRAREERMVGGSCISGVYLDELDPDAGNMASEVLPQCSFFCGEWGPDGG